MPSTLESCTRLISHAEGTAFRVRSLVATELHRIREDLHPRLSQLQRDRALVGSAGGLHELLSRVAALEEYLHAVVTAFPPHIPLDAPGSMSITNMSTVRPPCLSGTYPFLGGHRNTPQLNHGHSAGKLRAYRSRDDDVRVCGASLVVELGQGARRYALYNIQNICSGVLPVPTTGHVSIPHGEWDVHVWEGKGSVKTVLRTRCLVGGQRGQITSRSPSLLIYPEQGLWHGGWETLSVTVVGSESNNNVMVRVDGGPWTPYEEGHPVDLGDTAAWGKTVEACTEHDASDVATAVYYRAPPPLPTDVVISHDLRVTIAPVPSAWQVTASAVAHGLPGAVEIRWTARGVAAFRTVVTMPPPPPSQVASGLAMFLYSVKDAWRRTGLLQTKIKPRGGGVDVYVGNKLVPPEGVLLSTETVHRGHCVVNGVVENFELPVLPTPVCRLPLLTYWLGVLSADPPPDSSGLEIFVDGLQMRVNPLTLDPSVAHEGRVVLPNREDVRFLLPAMVAPHPIAHPRISCRAEGSRLLFDELPTSPWVVRYRVGEGGTDVRVTSKETHLEGPERAVVCVWVADDTTCVWRWAFALPAASIPLRPLPDGECVVRYTQTHCEVAFPRVPALPWVVKYRAGQNGDLLTARGGDTKLIPMSKDGEKRTCAVTVIDTETNVVAYAHKFDVDVIPPPPSGISWVTWVRHTIAVSDLELEMWGRLVALFLEMMPRPSGPRVAGPRVFFDLN